MTGLVLRGVARLLQVVICAVLFIIDSPVWTLTVLLCALFGALCRVEDSVRDYRDATKRPAIREG